MEKQKGFTLIELIMVIVILGVLAAAAIPKYVSLKEQTELALCNSNRGAIESVCLIHYAEKALEDGEGWFPTNPEDPIYYANGVSPLCPSGGFYTYDWDTGKITDCSVHLTPLPPPLPPPLP